MIEERVKKLIAEINFWSEEEAEEVAWNNLLETNVIDSMAAVYLVSLLEEEFKIKISLSEMKVEDFASLESIVGIVKKHL